jgi:transcription elongation GreA/GreB family factor
VSVAFRRESDDEHKEPRFERPIPPGPNLVTQRGLDEIERQLAESERLVAAESDPDRKEAARRDLRYWTTRRATAQLMPSPPLDSVSCGARVRFRLDGRERAIEIVGGDEADPAAGRIAFSAPLARALMEGVVGDRLDFAGRPDAIEILAIERRA